MNESILKSIENIFLWSTYHKQDLFFKGIYLYIKYAFIFTLLFLHIYLN